MSFEKNLEDDTTIDKRINERNDKWAGKVSGRLTSILCLRAEKAVYKI